MAEKDAALDAVSRLGAPVQTCDECGKRFVVRLPHHWVNVYVDGELVDLHEFMCCSMSCGEAKERTFCLNDEEDDDKWFALYQPDNGTKRD